MGTRRVFGNSVTAKHWRELFERTIDRDAGAEEWERLEIYVEEKPAPVSRRSPASAARERRFEILEDAFVALPASAPLRPSERTYLWTKACNELRVQLEELSTRKFVRNQSAHSKRIKRAILNVLVTSGLVGNNISSLRRTFARKWKTYNANGNGGLVDGRTLRYVTAAEVLPEEDLQKVKARALDCGGRISQAFRELHQAGELSTATTERFIANPKSKSYVPHSVRRVVTPEVKRLMPLHRGEREHELRGAFVRRDYSGMFAGDSYQADDCTCPVYYWEPDTVSRPGYRLIRGQLLLMIDERSLLALGFALHSENNYNARIIRALITRVHDGYGLPRRRFYFERGIWREARIINGQRQDSTELPMSHTELGLREHGLEITHARFPRGKVIERVLGSVQNQMERLPGYVGRDEKTERFERVQKQLSEARACHIHPSKHFLSKPEWEDHLTKLLAGYNEEPQHGRQLKGQSPIDVWNENQAPDGVVRFNDASRYLLAHHKLKMRVRQNGVTLRPSLGGATYCGEATGKLIHEDVWIWFNPEEPEYIAITSADGRRGPFVVPRLDPLPAIDATTEQFNQAKAQIGAHNQQARTSYRLVAPHLARRTFRRELVDARTIRNGERLKAEIEKAKTTKRNFRSSARKACDASRKLGVRVAITDETAERAAIGLSLIEGALAADGSGEER